MSSSRSRTEFDYSNHLPEGARQEDLITLETENKKTTLSSKDQKKRRSSHPDFERLCYEARRQSQRGRDALQVLQDALMIHYEREFKSAIRKSQKPKYPLTVVFIPKWARHINNQFRLRDLLELTEPDVPFKLVATEKTPSQKSSAVVVWYQPDKFNVHWFVSWRLARVLEADHYVVESRGAVLMFEGSP